MGEIAILPKRVKCSGGVYECDLVAILQTPLRQIVALPV